MKNKTLLLKLFILLFLGYITVGCNSSSDKEKELLEKENDLLKRENALIIKEQNSTNTPSLKADSNSAVLKNIQITKKEVEAVFKKYQSKIEGTDRDCWSVNVFISDIDNNGYNDGIVKYVCGVKDNPGNASAGNGIVVFLNKNGKLEYDIDEEEYIDFVPERVSKNIIYGETLTYAPEDARCCPSIHAKMKLRYENGSLIKVQ